ncbi:MAG TPA: hypothetical protein VGP70_21675 [Actinomadura sp.]|nr:hypothetical protein [Actinomadura sp.]
MFGKEACRVFDCDDEAPVFHVHLGLTQVVVRHVRVWHQGVELEARALKVVNTITDELEQAAAEWYFEMMQGD